MFKIECNKKCLIILKFVKSRVGGSREGCKNLVPDLGSETDSTLFFESRFESGNLMKAVKM